MSAPKMQSIYNILNRQFIKRSVIPIAIFGVILIGVVYLFNAYQREENRSAVKELTQGSFGEIAMQTALNINRQFTSNRNTLYQLLDTTQLLLKYKDRLGDDNATWVNRDGFFINPHMVFTKGKTPVYTTNLDQLNSSDINYLDVLINLTPIVKTCVDSKDDLITAAWINFGKYYSLSYPLINPINELYADLDVTKYPFYFLADEENNPDKQIIFTSLYKEKWAIDAGELGAYLMPVYFEDKFLGVIGFTLTADAIAKTIKHLKLPFNAYALLVDKDGYLIASSDNQRSYETFGVSSFYELYQDKTHPNRTMMQLPKSSKFEKQHIIHKQEIKGTNFELIICARNEDVFKIVEAQNTKALQLGGLIVGFLILLYILFISFTKKSITVLAQEIVNTVKSTLSFSAHMGEIDQLSPIRTNITEFQELGDKLYTTHQKLRDLINKDPQTGLYNLHQLQNDIDETKQQSLMRLQVNNFHQLFNLYGQDSITTVIKALADTLIRFENVTPYRLHENEFALLHEERNNTLFETIFETIHKLEIRYNAIHIKPLIYSGVAMTYPLLEESGIALLEAERTQTTMRPIRCSETSNAKQKFLDNLEWATHVEHAFEHDLFVPYFQPIFDLNTNKITKFEALVRLKQDDKVLSPYLFLQAISDVGKSHILTRLMIEKVCSVAKDFPDISFSINISFNDLHTPDFLEFISTHTKKHEIKPENITLELLENEAIGESQHVIQTITLLKQQGFKIAIDDFGTGHSNFAHLMSMRVDFIKIDGQFIKNIIKDPNSVTITKTIAQFAALVNAKTVAEFVADESIIKRVRQLNIDYIQGYAISPPLPKEQLAFILQKDFSHVG